MMIQENMDYPDLGSKDIIILNLSTAAPCINKHDSDGMGHHKWSLTGYGIVEDV
jgi:hypothetical protein